MMMTRKTKNKKKQNYDCVILEKINDLESNQKKL